MMQTVRLLGDLADRYGEEHEYYNLRTPAEAIKLLCINKPELQEELIHAHEHGIGYRLIQAGVDLDYDDLTLPVGSNDLILVPVVAGSGGSGIGRILVGGGLGAAAFFTGGATIGLLGLAAPLAVSSVLGTIGASLILGGVSQLLSPQPQLSPLGGNRFESAEATSTDGPQSIVRGSDGRQSYAYTGAANTVGVGATIPVAYGEVLIGSNLLSATVDVADESDPLKAAVKTPGTNTVLFGGEKLTFAYSKSSGVLAKRANAGEPFPGGSGKRFNTLNQGIDLFRGNNRPLGQINKERSECAVVLEIQNGLYDFASGPGSTLVDGFVTYKLITETRVSGPDPKTGTSQATIQGLLLPGQVYRWIHRFENQKIENDNRGIKINIEIVDFAAAPGRGIGLIVRSAGFT